MKRPIPLILDTDIGSDIDDTWALAMILKSPEIDLKLVTTEEDDTVYKAKLCCKMLDAAGRSDIPVAAGIKNSENSRNLIDWVKDYDLDSYKNYKADGVDALIETVMSSEEQVTILAIGPFKNLAAAYEKEPRIAKHSRLVIIGGNIYNGCFPTWIRPLSGEWNIRCDLDAYRRGVEKTDWEVEMLPLDVSGNIALDTPYFEKIREAAKNDPLLNTVIECNDLWFKVLNWDYHGPTSPLFDTVGVYSVITRENFNYQRLPIYTSDESVTLIDPVLGKDMNVAISWKDKEKFYRFLTARMCGEI